MHLWGGGGGGGGEGFGGMELISHLCFIIISTLNTVRDILSDLILILPYLC